MVWFIILGAFIAIIVAYILIIQFPSLASQVSTVLDAIIYYLSQAMGIVWLFVPQQLTVVLMSLAISIEVIMLGYKFVMWILRKIPTAGID